MTRFGGRVAADAELERSANFGQSISQPAGRRQEPKATSNAPHRETGIDTIREIHKIRPPQGRGSFLSRQVERKLPMRRAWILWAALTPWATGCQTFQPYGYPSNYVGPYGGSTYGPSPAIPPGGLTPTPTPAPNLGSPAQSWPSSTPSTNVPRGSITPLTTYPPSQPTGVPASKPVPNYENKRAPATLGAPVDDSPDNFRNPSSSLTPSQGVRLSEITDDSEENLAGLGEEGFAKPVPVVSVAGATTAASRVSPYRKDRNGYGWLRGVVSFDETEQNWRLTYNPDPGTNDPYHGNLVLVGSDQLDNLLPDDVVLVEGTIDPTQKDRRFGKPSYRVRHLKRLEPLGED
jgi:hypothetical protein